VVGSVNVTPVATFTVSLDKIPTVNLGLGTVNVGNAVGVFGSVQVVGSVNVTAVGGSLNVVADTRNGKTATMWPIKVNAGGAGVTLIASGLFPMSVYGMLLAADATVYISLQSPSGTNLTGTIFLLPGGGFAENNHMSSPLYPGVPSGLYLWQSAAANLGGVVRGTN
jgi:hypothetical protein